MNGALAISGFSDEISQDLDTQLSVVSGLGMHYISLRSVNGKNISEFDESDIKGIIFPKLQKWGIGISSIGSPVGKVFIDDEDGYEKQKVLLEKICRFAKLLDCKYIRIFSFYIPQNENADKYCDKVIYRLKEFVGIAEKHNVKLLHENEKDIFGDISRRCKIILEGVASPYFKAIFDFANFVQCGEDTQKCYELLKEEIVYFHIKDAISSDRQNVVCGTGEGKIFEILAQAISNGYTGFLTLEPHLVYFDALNDLELEDAKMIIKDNKGLNGSEGYKLQYESLVKILNRIKPGFMN